MIVTLAKVYSTTILYLISLLVETKDFKNSLFPMRIKQYKTLYAVFVLNNCYFNKKKSLKIPIIVKTKTHNQYFSHEHKAI